MCVHVYICAYTHAYVHICIHTHTWSERERLIYFKELAHTFVEAEICRADGSLLPWAPQSAALTRATDYVRPPTSRKVTCFIQSLLIQILTTSKKIPSSNFYSDV